MNPADRDSPRWPALARWLPREGRHLFRPGNYPWPEDVYTRLDELIASIESVRPVPVGLPQKRSMFKKGQPDELLALRSELLTADRLARHAVRFNCPAFPDFTCSGPYGGAVEVTSRTKNDLEQLEFRLRGLSNPKNLQFKVTGGGPVLGTALVERVVAEAAPIFHQGIGGGLEYPAANLRVSISRVIDISIDLEEAVAGWRRELDVCVTQLPDIIAGKTAQAEKAAGPLPIPLVLLVDVSRFASFGSLIGPFFMKNALATLAASLEVLDLGAFDALAVAISNLQTNSYTGVMRGRSGLTDVAGAQLDLLEAALLSHP